MSLIVARMVLSDEVRDQASRQLPRRYTVHVNGPCWVPGWPCEIQGKPFCHLGVPESPGLPWKQFDSKLLAMPLTKLQLNCPARPAAVDETLNFFSSSHERPVL